MLTGLGIYDRIRFCQRYAGIAQLVEHLTCNEDVAGSSPVSSSILFYMDRFPSG
jgi:hypothetical protein